MRPDGSLRPPIRLPSYADLNDYQFPVQSAGGRRPGAPDPGRGSAAGDRGRLVHADALDQRIGMPMHQLPLGAFPAENQRHAR